ncbi:MAG: SUMF1/EgtB/PvdO family nonheme iron enzyme [Polyangiales bacterium]
MSIRMDANRRSFLRRTLFQGAVVAVAVCAGMTAANALTAGRAGGHARSALTVSGTINGPGLGASVMVNYVFLKGGSAVCTVPTTLARDTATGRFTGEVDTAMCPSNLFDGSDVTVRVDVGDAGVATGAVNPVPYARYAEQVGTPDCPVGYEREVDGATPPGRWICRDRYGDDVVRVGDGSTAFWIDRYEATIWTTRGGVVTGGNRLFDNETNFDPVRFPRNGQWSSGLSAVQISPPAYALSVAGGAYFPARWVTWFQAQEACRASGKRLPTGEEWGAAAQGTVDPGASNGAGGQCVTLADGPRNAGGGTLCRSSWGTQDMIGNVLEMTAEWFAGSGNGSSPGALVNDGVATWPSGYGYNDDQTFNVNGAVRFDGAGRVTFGSPSVAARGGGWNDSVRGGIYYLSLGGGPSFFHPTVGFRCVIPR